MISKKLSGFVCFIGMPNVGKSTLLNSIMGEKLAIISPKIQTTRYAMQAIYNDDSCQIVFIDTPGVLEVKYLMHAKMMSQLDKAIAAADIRVFIFDAANIKGEETLIRWKHDKIPHLTIVNKVDRIDQQKKEDVQKQLEALGYHEIMFLSAHNAASKQLLIDKLKGLLPDAHPFFEDEDQISDRSVRFFCAEFIREQLYLLLGREIPYEATAVVDEFKEFPTLVRIFAHILVSRSSQKKIVIGEKGAKITLIGQRARLAMEKLLNKKVYLGLRVKVRKDWRKKAHFLNEYGF